MAFYHVKDGMFSLNRKILHLGYCSLLNKPVFLTTLEMAPPARTTGLAYHLFYPLISAVLLAIAAFSSADSVWYISANTATESVS